MRTMTTFPTVPGYSIIEKIGVGSYSIVFKAKKKGTSDAIVAIKCMEKRLQHPSYIDRVVQEISILKMAKHEFIVEFIDFLWDTKYIFIIMEYCDEGDLSHFIRKKYKIAEPLVKMFMQQLALALRFLKQYNICHMDLKPQNILLCSKPKLKVKIGDFGLSQILSPENAEEVRFNGSLLYMAPEKLLRKQYDSRIDLWSLGIIMYECLFGRTPFFNMNKKQIIEFFAQKQQIPLPPNATVSPPCAQLLDKLLKYDLNERISYEEFFQNEWLDLQHMATTDNYLTAVKLIHEAIDFDRTKEYAQALTKYKHAISYLENFIPSQVDATKKSALVYRLNDYIERVNALERIITGQGSASASKSSILPLSLESFETLKELSVMTPGISTGIDIGYMGDMYLAEGKHKIAYEKYTSALNVLLPLLEKEPPGLRKSLLHSQIQKWLHLAEVLKKNDG